MNEDEDEDLVPYEKDTENTDGFINNVVAIGDIAREIINSRTKLEIVKAEIQKMDSDNKNTRLNIQQRYELRKDDIIEMRKQVKTILQELQKYDTNKLTENSLKAYQSILLAAMQQNQSINEVYEQILK